MSFRSQTTRLIDQVPALGRAFRDYRDRRAVSRLTVHKMPGYDFELFGGNWFAAGYLPDRQGFHEALEVEIMADLMRDADMLIDVGANSGLFACLAASEGLNCIAFEPMPANIPILLKNIRHNGFEEKIEVLPVAISNKSGVLALHGRGQVASLIEGWAGQPSFDNILVPVNTLDNLLADRLEGHRLAIKIDVEGAELQVLEGAKQLLMHGPPVLLENSLTRNQPGGVSQTFAAVFYFLWDLGYSAFVANVDRDEVTRSRLDRWLENGSTDLNTENFFFKISS